MDTEGISPAPLAMRTVATVVARAGAVAPENPERPTEFTKALRAAKVERESTPNVDARDREKLEEAVHDGNEHLRHLNQQLTFEFHDESGQFMVQVVDRNTGEVVRESPPAEFLDLAVRLKEMVGLFLDETR